MEEERRKKKMLYIKKEEKKMTYLLGPESEASPASPVPSSSRSARSACWSTSSPGGTQSLQTPGGSSGRGEEGKGSQVNFKGKLFSTLHARNCRTAAYNCTGNLEGNLNSGLGKTTALSGRILTEQWEGRTTGNLNGAASLATQHLRHDGCNSQGGLQQ